MVSEQIFRRQNADHSVALARVQQALKKSRQNYHPLGSDSADDWKKSTLKLTGNGDICRCYFRG